MKELTAETIKRGLKTRCIGREVIYYTSLPSTMDAARDEALKGAKEGTVIIAGEQTGGRGRLQRAWLAPKGNVALSIILHPDIKSLPCLIMIASLSVVRSIESIASVKAGIKWPNDVLIGGKKTGGILIENEVVGNKVAFSIVGIGININLKVDDYNEIAETATSLKKESGKDDLRINIIRSLLEELERLYLSLPEGKPIYEAWRDRLVTLGKNVKAQSGSQVIEGIAEAVDESGALVIRGEDGRLTRVVAGDVTLRKK
ncbi:MAG: biotin--[acetyl-CoA-carboxylase] ligase [Dehalococcoidales bacterium]|nr:biotin--[acetyl-CoA-carboxylase] ligase [Dehalococcoidales bacterium]